MSTDQSNPPPLVRPIWTPDDARQAAADAAQHRAEPGVPAGDVDLSRGLVLVRYRGPERAGMRPRRARRLTKTVLAAAAIVTLMAAGVLWAASRAGAAPLPGNCQQQLWLYGGLFGRWTTRTICDGPIREDGSWLRSRNFYASARWVPVSCSWGSYGGSCSGGYPLPEFDTGVEQYVVTVDTVLADEPGHIGVGER